jgi:hypothetical protein
MCLDWPQLKKSEVEEVSNCNPKNISLKNTLYNISWGKLCQSNLDALFYQFLGPLFENESGKINLSKFQTSVDITNMMIPSLLYSVLEDYIVSPKKGEY